MANTVEIKLLDAEIRQPLQIIGCDGDSPLFRVLSQRQVNVPASSPLDDVGSILTEIGVVAFFSDERKGVV